MKITGMKYVSLDNSFTECLNGDASTTICACGANNYQVQVLTILCEPFERTIKWLNDQYTHTGPFIAVENDKGDLFIMTYSDKALVTEQQPVYFFERHAEYCRNLDSGSLPYNYFL